jgi:glycosyltransferase involved in cell wall biosynthesis
LPARYGGFETLVHYITLKLATEFEFQVYCSKRPKSQQVSEINGARLIYFPLKANGWQSVIYDILTIIHAWLTADILLVLGNSGALIFPFNWFIHKDLVINIGGIDWRRAKWNFITRKYIQISEWLAVRFADKVITDNKMLHEYYLKNYNCKSSVIPYGGDHVLKSNKDLNYEKKYPFLNFNYAISVSRAQEDNLLHMVLEAFSKMEDEKLVLISNWDSSAYGKRLKEAYKGISNIYLLDAIYDLKELDLLRCNASLYIHSHSFCGTAPSLVEAMNHGLPIICYDAPTNRATTLNEAIYFSDEESLINQLEMISSDDLDSKGKRMLEIGRSAYNWNTVTTEYRKLLQNNHGY